MSLLRAFMLLAHITIISISTCAAHGMHMQAESRRETLTDKKGPKLRKNQARTENVPVRPCGRVSLILAENAEENKQGS